MNKTVEALMREITMLKHRLDEIEFGDTPFHAIDSVGPPNFEQVDEVSMPSSGDFSFVRDRETFLSHLTTPNGTFPFKGAMTLQGELGEEGEAIVVGENGKLEWGSTLRWLRIDGGQVLNT